MKPHSMPIASLAAIALAGVLAFAAVTWGPRYNPNARVQRTVNKAFGHVGWGRSSTPCGLFTGPDGGHYRFEIYSVPLYINPKSVVKSVDGIEYRVLWNWNDRTGGGELIVICPFPDGRRTFYLTRLLGQRLSDAERAAIELEVEQIVQRLHQAGY